MNYIPRILDKKINQLITNKEAILIYGCKWCGKTTTGKYYAKSITELQNEEHQEEYKEIINIQPSLLLKGEKPQLISEWTKYPVIFNTIQNDIKKNQSLGQYILTTSTQTEKIQLEDISQVQMRSMSLYETKESTGEVSLKDILNDQDIQGKSNLTLEQLASIIVRGGWPATLNVTSDVQYNLVKKYVRLLIREEINNIDGTKRNSQKMLILLKALANRITTQVSNSALEEYIQKNYHANISRPTIIDYLNTLEKLFIIENIQATNLKFTSKYKIRTTPQKYFVDPSIVTAILEMTPTELFNDLKTFSLLFKSLCIRDLQIYAQNNNGSITFYKDEKNFEIDAILTTTSGKWGAIEIKLGEGYIDNAAKKLIKFQQKVDTNIHGSPAFLMVLTNTDISYKRDDGVYVVSIGTLKD